MSEMHNLEKKTRSLAIYACKPNDPCYINSKQTFSTVPKIWSWNSIIARNHDNRNHYIFMMISCILS